MRPAMTRERNTQASPQPIVKKQKCSNKNVGNVKYLATPLTKLLGPVFKLL
jgi:hypothetical protein